MADAKAGVPSIQEILRPFRRHQRLVALVKTLALEIERLDEDNVQLRAAVSMYREAIRRAAANRPPATSLRSA